MAGVKLLIVEDEAKIADFLVRTLLEEGFSVEQVGDVESPRHSPGSDDGNLILLHQSSPYGDGLSILRSLRETGVDVPILVPTARDSASDRVRVLTRALLKISANGLLSRCSWPGFAF